MNKKEFIEKYGKSLEANYTKLDGVMYVRYEVGGVCGGSCWDDSNPTSYSVGKPDDDDFHDLVNCLEDVAPLVTLLQFRKIEQIISYTEDVEYEYYGNSVEYRIDFINLDLLWDILEDMGYVSND
jgi:hypothetical protein